MFNLCQLYFVTLSEIISTIQKFKQWSKTIKVILLNIKKRKLYFQSLKTFVFYQNYFIPFYNIFQIFSINRSSKHLRQKVYGFDILCLPARWNNLITPQSWLQACLEGGVINWHLQSGSLVNYIIGTISWMSYSYYVMSLGRR